MRTFSAFGSAMFELMSKSTLRDKSFFNPCRPSSFGLYDDIIEELTFDLALLGENKCGKGLNYFANVKIVISIFSKFIKRFCCLHFLFSKIARVHFILAERRRQDGTLLEFGQTLIDFGKTIQRPEFRMCVYFGSF